MAEGKQAAPIPETTELHVPETMHIEPTHETPQAEPAERPKSPRQAAMERIIERAEEQRQKEKQTHREIALASGDEVPEEEASEEPAPAPEPASEPEPAPTPIATAPEQPAPQRRVLNINGTNVELTDDEMAQLARMGALASMQQRQPAQQQPAQQAIRPAQQAPHQPVAVLDNEMAKALAKKVLFGDEESGAQAFQDLAEHLAGKFAQPGPAFVPEQIAANAARQAYAQIQFEKNLETVGKEYPDVFSDDNLSLIAAKRVGELRQKYAVLQQPRTDLDLYREALKETNDRYVRSVAPQSGAESSQPPAQAAQQAPVQSDRLERKRAAPKTPAAANRTASMPEAPRAPTGSDIVAWMKKTRGQPYVQ